MSSHKLPAIQFYPGDWRKDAGVQSLSFHDRGVWFEMLLLMHDSDRRGVLTLNTKPMTEDQLSRIIGLDKQTLTTTLTTLLTCGVASLEEGSDALMCRRMVRDEQLRKTRAEAGKLGGNPLLLIQKSTNPDKQKATTGDKQIPTPSSSTSTSTSTSTTGQEQEPLASTAGAVPARPSEPSPFGTVPVSEANQAYCTIPLTGSKQHIVTLDALEAACAAYPAVDVRQELAIMLQWLDAHPEKRSHSVKGAKGRIVNWMSAKQDKGGSTQGGSTNAADRRDKSPGQRRVEQALDALRSNGIDLTQGTATGCPYEVQLAARGVDGRGSAGVVLEGFA